MDTDLPNPVANRSWTDPLDSLTDFVNEVSPDDVSLADLIGAEAIKRVDNFSIPLLATYQHKLRRTTYRRGDGLVQIVDGKVPDDGCWVEADPRMSLSKAQNLYGSDLLAYQKTQSDTTLEVLILSVRERHEQSLRLLVRKRSSNPVSNGAQTR